MFSVKFSRGWLALLLAVLLLAGCNGDLKPSGTDNRAPVTAGSIGNMPGQLVVGFSLPQTDGTVFRLSDHLAGGPTPANAIVLYFTMWCPICLSHTDHLLQTLMPQFAARGTTRYLLVDYVSGSVAGTLSSAQANGYVGTPLRITADTNLGVFNQFSAAMGTTVVIDGYGTIQMNEDYRNGANLAATLNRILP